MANAGEYVKAGCFGYVGVILGIFLLSMLGCGGCIAMMGGCTVFGVKAIDEAAKHSSERMKREAAQQAGQAALDVTNGTSQQSDSSPSIPRPQDDVAGKPATTVKPIDPIPAKEEPKPEPVPELPSPPPKDDKLRTWRDASGQFNIEAEFRGMSFGSVKLKKQDGKLINVPLEKLSDEDKKWIERKSR